MATCEIESCENRARARGLCQRHGAESRKIPCSVSGCGNFARARDLCSMHYYRLNKSGDPGEAERRRKGKRSCRVIGCANDAITSDDLCPTHRRRKRLYGDEQALATTKPCAVCGEPSMYGRRFDDRCEVHAWGRLVEMYLAGEHAGVRDPKTGYLYLAVGKTRKTAHRAVMEEVLGRPLLPMENVHHRNGRRDDNRPANLELWVKSQPSGQRVEDLVQFVVEHYPEETRAALAMRSSHADE